MIKKIPCFFAFLSAAILITSPARAGQVRSIVECSKIAEDTDRLNCYDIAAKQQSGAQSRDQSAVRGNIQPAGPAMPMVPAKITREEKIDNFGKSQLRKSPVKKIRIERKKEVEKRDLDKITLTVEKYSYTASKKFVLFMKNGQVWKQHESGNIRLPKGEFEVTVKKGLLGGYNMIVPTKRIIIKVKRLR